MPSREDDVVVQLREENARLGQRVSDLEALKERLESRIADLQAELSRHSGNSSKPPSSDTLTQRAAQKARREGWRKKKRRRPGKQRGAEGRYLAQVADPDVVVRHVPEACETCRGSDICRTYGRAPETLSKKLASPRGVHSCGAASGANVGGDPRRPGGTAEQPNSNSGGLGPTLPQLAPDPRPRIEELRQLREELTGCIGCGCLSLKTCALANPADQAAKSGSGARYLLTTQNEDGASTDTG